MIRRPPSYTHCISSAASDCYKRQVILFEAQRQRLQAGLYEKCRLDPDIYEKLVFEFSYPEAAKVYQSKGEDYPELDTEGQIIS